MVLRVEEREQDTAGSALEGLTNAMATPLVCRDPAELSWSETADVVVVGYGAAGACAAIEAAERGASALVVERFGGGGATRLSGGVYYGGGGTRFQVEANAEDSVGDLFRYLRLEAAGAVSDETLKTFAAESNPNLEWLLEHGVRYGSRLVEGKTSYPPLGFYLYYSGNERLAGFREEACPAPRGHRAVSEPEVMGPTGFAFFEALDRAARKAGVQILSHAPATRLVTDAHGAVLGVEINELPPESAARAAHAALDRSWSPINPFTALRRRSFARRAAALERRHGVRRLVRARRGVILCSGGFINDDRLVASGTDADLSRAARMAALGCDGAAIRLAMPVGAGVDRLGRLALSRNLGPPVYTKGILVDRSGRRFINEEAYSGSIGDAILDGGHRSVWLIVDDWTRNQALRAAMPWNCPMGFLISGLPVLLNLFAGGARKGDSIEAIACKLKMDPEILGATVARYNATAAGHEPDPFGKDSAACRPLVQGPFHALNVSLNSRGAPVMVFTLGGLAVDERTGQVRGRSGGVIGGLYAGGRAAVGVCSGTYVSGLSIADCVFSGRRAARACLAADGPGPGPGPTLIVTEV